MPIETPRGTFYHYPKAGGTWVTQVLMEQFAGKIVGPGGHTPMWAHPPAVAPGFGVLRDPYTLYESYYLYSVRAKRQGGIAFWGKAYTNDYLKAQSFEAFLYGMTHPHNVPEFERGSIGIVHQPLRPERAIEELQSGEAGFASWMLFDMFRRQPPGGPQVEVTLLPQARLEEALGKLMGEEVRPTRKPAHNSSRHISASVAYTDEMWKWVEDADGEMLALHERLAASL